MQKTIDVLIIGAGVIGCAIAYHLCKRGIHACVLDQGEIGAQSSSAAAGLLAPIRPFSLHSDPNKALQLASLARFPSLIAALEEESGVATEYERISTLRLLPPDKLASAHRWCEAWGRAGFHLEVLSPEETYRHEPLLFPGLVGAVYATDEAQITPTRLVKAYAQAARQFGTSFFEQTPVVAFQQAPSGQRITGVKTAQGEIFHCGHLILATGVWSEEMGRRLGSPLPVYPIRGEIIAVQQPASSPLSHLIFDEGNFDPDISFAPKPGNLLFIGGTKQHVGLDTSVSVGGVLHLLTTATRLIPELSGCAIKRTWAGLRPKTANSSPFLGPIPPWENVLAACGHGAFGILLSAITGELIADVVATGQIPELLRPFVAADSH